MRSRYAAYAKGDAAYIQETTDPDGPMFDADTESWTESILRFRQGFRFTGVRILEALPPDEHEGQVTFHAGLEANGEDGSFRERSRFTKADNRWRYHSGERLS